MSIQNCQNNISRLRRELADIEKRLSDETRNEVEKTKRINQLESSIHKNTSVTTIQTKRREVTRVGEEISRIHAKKADINKRIADKTAEIHRYEQDLLKEQERERKKLHDAERRRERERLNHQRALTRELTTQKSLARQFSSALPVENNVSDHAKTYDLFICHASEDKDDFVRPLAEALQQLNVSVWYDEFQLKVGDSLRRSIDYGLANSRYGAVVLSSAFFAKNWPQYELDGLVAKEMRGAKVILPIWHKVSKDEVMSYSPSLADKVALNSSILSIDEIAKQLAEVVKD